MQDVKEASLTVTVDHQKTPAVPARIIGILGMHRSGTSCLTGSLQNAGLFLGEHHTWNRHNLRGNRENQNIVDLHDDILEANGGAWDSPPEHVRWREEDVARARELLAEYSEHAMFGFKDPRALLALEGWKSLCPDIEFVGIFRHPNAVAASLDKRTPKPWEECVALWYTYNSILYREYQKKPFPIIDFDVEEEVLDANIARVVDSLGLSGSDSEEKFYTSELKNNSSSGRRLPWRVRRLYKKLKKASL
tara:strand:+ start:10376 stop:11122 length:747 start_codon:yes stop_codon:yes gene_type:complete